MGATFVVLNGSFALSPEKALWALLILVAAASQAFALHYARRHPPQPTGLALQFVFAAAALGLLSRVFEPMPRLEPVSRWSAADALWLLALAGPATALAYGLYYRLLVKVAAAQAASTQWLQFAVTVTESAAIFRQRPPLVMLAALAVLLVCAARMLLVPVREEVPIRLADRR